MENNQEEILVLPFFGQGHLFPCIELCKHLSKRNYKITLVISSFLTSSIPSTLTIDYPFIQIAELPSSGPHPPPPPPSDQVPPSTGPPPGHGPFHKRHLEMESAIDSLLSTRSSKRPACAVIDVMMSWSKLSFTKFGVPVVSFITSGACSAAMEYAMWKAQVSELKPGETRELPGLPDEMTSISYEEVNNIHPRHMPPGRHQRGGQPMWLDETETSIAILMNTCSELEGPFLNYVAAQLRIPVWGVGPLLPEQYYCRSSLSSSGSTPSILLRDRDFRPKKDSSHSEQEVIQWLDSKPSTSVLYISFGSELSPTKDELAELATALEETNHSFIWVIRPGSGRPGPPAGGDHQQDEGYNYPHGLDKRVGSRGLIIHGWAPQLLILSHPSTGGFLSHCGWNSTVEAIGRGVPFLAWPIGRDQPNNAKMVVNHLKIGYNLVKESADGMMVTKDDIVGGIEKLMGDVEVKRRACLLKQQFEGGFPKSSMTALDVFGGFLSA